jgi:hypothetical protein
LVPPFLSTRQRLPVWSRAGRRCLALSPLMSRQSGTGVCVTNRRRRPTYHPMG